MAKAPAKTQEENPQGDLIEKIDAPVVEQTENEEIEQPIEAADDEVEDASVALQKQIDALRRSEEIQKNRAERFRQESETAKQLAQERSVEIEKVRKESIQSQATALDTALEAAKNEAESAKRDIKTAINNGDPDAQADALERLAAARANISQLETGRIEIETRLNTPEPVRTEQQPGLPQRIQRWLQKHPEYTKDPRKYDKLRSLHWDVIDEGHDFDSDEYLESMEVKLGMREIEQEEEEPVVRKPSGQKSSIVSAPVSREGPSSPGSDRNSGLVKLNAAQREAAKMAGVTEKVYAEQLLKINKMKANGTYGGQQ